VLALRALVVTAVAAALALTWADPDLWGHVTFGRDIAAHGLTTADPYSFTSDIPWVNHEWLAELLMYAAYALAGGAGLIVFKGAIAIGAVSLAHAPVRRPGADPLLSDALLVVLAAGVWVRVYVARPQIFSLLLFAALLWALLRIEAGARRWLVVVPVIFAAWVNLHGGWVVGLGILGVWTIVTCTTTPSIRSHAIAALVLAAAATLCNPYGIGMWRFLAETVRPNRPYIDDWRPLFATPAVLVLWLPAAFAAAYAIVKRRSGVSPGHLAIVILLGAASLRVSRLDAFFAIATISLLGHRIASSRPSRAQIVGLSLRVAVPLVAAACLVVLIALPTRTQIGCVRMNGLAWLPEPNVAPAILRRQLHGNLLTWFGWGEYAIWYFGQDLKVSFDGRRETVYSDAFGASHVALYWVPDRQREFLAKLNPDYAWVPANIPLAAALQRDGWSPIFSGPKSIVLSRVLMSPGDAGELASSTLRCFPGP